MFIKDFLSPENFFFLFNFIQDYAREKLNYQYKLNDKNKTEIGKFMEVIYENNYNSMTKKTANAIVLTEFKKRLNQKHKKKFLQSENIDNFDKIKTLKSNNNFNKPSKIISEKFNPIFKNQAKEIYSDFITKKTFEPQLLFKDVLQKLKFKEHDLSKAPINEREQLLIPQPDIFKNMFDKPLYIENISVLLDSRDRNTDLYPNTHNYSIKLDSILKNVISVELLQATIPNSEYLINNNNNTIYFQETIGTTLSAQITNGNYISGSDIATELQNTMNTYGNSSYSVTYSTSTSKFTISSDRTGGAGIFILKFQDTPEIFGTYETRSKYLLNSLGPILGFSNLDLSDASSHTSQNKSNLNSDRSIYIYVNPNSKSSFDNIEGIKTSDFGKFMKLGLKSDFGKYTFWNNQAANFRNLSNIPYKNPKQKIPEESDVIKVNKNENDFKLLFNPPITIDKLDIQFKNYNENLFDFHGLENSLLFRIEMFNFHYENIVLDYKFPELSSTEIPERNKSVLETIIEEELEHI